MLCERCVAMAFTFRKPSTACQITDFNLSGYRGALRNSVVECPLCAKSGHTLKLADCAHNKLWSERQIAPLRYGLLNCQDHSCNVGFIDFSIGLSVLRHVPDHRQQSAINVRPDNHLNVYVRELREFHEAVELSANVWRPTCMTCGFHEVSPVFRRDRLDDHHWPITFDDMRLATRLKDAPELADRAFRIIYIDNCISSGQPIQRGVR